MSIAEGSPIVGMIALNILIKILLSFKAIKVAISTVDNSSKAELIQKL